jgi:hypothetical protein
LRAYKRIGSIEAGSNVLKLNEASTFKVGDRIIVEVGGEEGKGRFGTIGVGGIRPAATDGWKEFYYRSKDLPLALIANIAEIADAGRTLILDKAAAADATNADVYFDNQPQLNEMLAEAHPPGWTITLPPGDFAISDKLEFSSRNGWIIKGAGKGVTILRSPKGVPFSGLQCFETNDTQIRDLTIIGNAGQNGFGLKEDGYGHVEYGVGILLTKCANCIIRNVSIVDVLTKAVWGEYTAGLEVYDCDLTINDPVRGYIAWWFGVSDSQDSMFARCVIRSEWLVPGFEMFRSNGVKFIDCSGRNAVFSSNSSGNFVLDGFTMTITADAQFDEESFSRFNPVVNINSNIQPPDKSMKAGGTISNIKIAVEGPIDARGNLLKGIVINSNNPNVTVNGGIILYPDGTHGAEIGPFGVSSDGTNTVVRNLTVTGMPAERWEANIHLRNGAVTACIAERIRVDSTS